MALGGGHAEGITMRVLRSRPNHDTHSIGELILKNARDPQTKAVAEHMLRPEYEGMPIVAIEHEDKSMSFYSVEEVT
jgi:hypothetical protein